MKEREKCLTTLHDVLFPPESTSSLAETGAASCETTRQDDQLFPVTSSSVLTKAISPDAGIRQVQGAIGALREASVISVEAVQRWRKFKAGQRESPDSVGRGAPVLARTNKGSRVEVESDATMPEIQISCASASLLGHPTSDGTDRQLPVVSPRTGLNPATAQLRGIARGADTALPTFWWIPPDASPHTPATDTNRRLGLGSAPNGPERASDDRTREAKRSLSATASSHRHPTETLGRRTAASSIAATAFSDTTCGAEIPPDEDKAVAQDSIAFDFGLNYLAKMASDTDFTGAPGSALVDFFPPDTKLFRNPFLLAHNLDDMLAVHNIATAHASSKPWGGETDRKNRSDGKGLGASIKPYDGSEGEESAGRRPDARIDTERIRNAAGIILAEDYKENARRKGSSAALDFGAEEQSQEPRLPSWEDPCFSSAGGITKETVLTAVESRQRQDDDLFGGEDDHQPEKARGTPPRSASAGKRAWKKRNKPKAASIMCENAGAGERGDSDEGKPETGVEPATMLRDRAHDAVKTQAFTTVRIVCFFPLMLC